MTPTDVYIMRVNWNNYNSAWHEGQAFDKPSSARKNARMLLEQSFKAAFSEELANGGQMIFKEVSSPNRADIEVYLRRVGKDDLWGGTAEIYRVPLAESSDDDD